MSFSIWFFVSAGSTFFASYLINRLCISSHPRAEISQSALKGRVGKELFCRPCSLYCNFSKLSMWSKAAVDYTGRYEHVYITTKSYLQKQVESQIWPLGQSSLALFLSPSSAALIQGKALPKEGGTAADSSIQD